MDKRILTRLFRDRLVQLLQRSGDNQSTFSKEVGIDRSALSQLLSEKSVRLPRIETLLNIAERYSVSLDWLLGLSHDEGLIGELHPSFEIEERVEGQANTTLLMQWHAEAAGSKVRYVPARIPDLLRTPEIIAYEARSAHQSIAGQSNETLFRLDYNRQPGTDMEVCMPMQTLEALAHGHGMWSGLDGNTRQRQLGHMANLIHELYPSFRLFLFDEKEKFSVPYTIFGSLRAAIFVGSMYLILNNTDAIRKMQLHFDGLIRTTRIHPHEAAEFVKALARVSDR
ncbi:MULTISPECIES: helix-turn-helix transcriptional regulator [unclassified Rhizobium]|uniref:helix-turn-helix domain-containing protein n=1 Tax=unclassified Rhizobium TaxID=2613769 RepID=UPI000648526D|nr:MULTISPECIES: helix-turn-helix transcriptional regulator [unclassified Rhizobium]MBN8952662.1 helix-turn-helix transcriptional regulator [Rhizobium tropici]OJY64483.1 MAG: transcriptional regulator [Rhizobium sp. 60-20]RKD72688.1 helix-turn-helix protein [Rhizobium sp. WW_1]